MSDEQYSENPDRLLGRMASRGSCGMQFLEGVSYRVSVPPLAVPP